MTSWACVCVPPLNRKRGWIITNRLSVSENRRPREVLVNVPHRRWTKNKRKSLHFYGLIFHWETEVSCNTSWGIIEKYHKKTSYSLVFKANILRTQQWFPDKIYVCVCVWEGTILLQFSNEEIGWPFVKQACRTRIWTDYSILYSAYKTIETNLKLEFSTSSKKKKKSLSPVLNF